MSGRACGRRRRRRLGRCAVELACNKHRGNKTNKDTKHWNPREIFLDEQQTPRDAFYVARPANITRRQRILAALSNVFHTPQASGTPTNSQNSAALASSPPLPMPNEPCWTAASLLALAA